MTNGVVNSSYSSPKGQAVKLIFFAPRFRKYKGEQELVSRRPLRFQSPTRLILRLKINDKTTKDEINFYTLQSARWAFTLLG